MADDIRFNCEIECQAVLRHRVKVSHVAFSSWAKRAKKLRKRQEEAARVEAACVRAAEYYNKRGSSLLFEVWCEWLEARALAREKRRVQEEALALDAKLAAIQAKEVTRVSAW